MTAAKPTEYMGRQKRGQNYHIISGLGGGHVPPVPPLWIRPSLEVFPGALKMEDRNMQDQLLEWKMQDQRIKQSIEHIYHNVNTTVCTVYYINMYRQSHFYAAAGLLTTKQ